MTTIHDNSQESFDPFLRALIAAINEGRSLDDSYSDDAIVVPTPGHVMAGQDRKVATDYLTGLGVPMRATVRHAYVVHDTALLIIDWELVGTTTDGTDIDMRGAATDVLRRDTDGHWRYLIDNPYGTA